MTQTVIQKTFAPIRKFLPRWFWSPIRSVVTAFLTPILYSYRTGHFLSSLQMKAVSKRGEPLPWYTYSSIDFLKYRNYDNKIVLEFGGGQSTLWWAKKAKHVVTLEGDYDWYEKIKNEMPANVDLNYVSMESVTVSVARVRDILSSMQHSKYDVIIIDGLYRFEMIEVARDLVADDGVIICDNAEGYGFYEGFKNSCMNKVDFYGNGPGVILPHCTSIYFKPSSFVFDAGIPIHVIAKDG